MVNNAICIIAAGNAAVFNVHPGGQNVSMFAVRLLNQAIVAVGGPNNLLTAVNPPTIESANELFNHPGINLLRSVDRKLTDVQRLEVLCEFCRAQVYSDLGDLDRLEGLGLDLTQTQ